MHPEPHDELRVASFRDLDTTTLYEILKLRSEVFVVEQECAYLDPDGRDTEPGTRHVWFAQGKKVRAYLRILSDHGVERIGRVVTAPEARGAGLAGRLITEAITVIGNRPSVLDAQAHLAGFYGRFGYVVDGPEFLEDGIPHVPMARGAAQREPAG
ncbi:GNAT family N-acetyltransferase [Actinoplanes xinjiangensis]|uniref:ElaA protein n=1 Tax=Actinoplanes xinjiangensis TaxID=512350 RepID=A0A316FPI8_9ACTN|nr:GNAT family N-acetyltransferase [Actinoplanes xinjiangensis]PWK50135.1 ElaA protein [Actinoplanes xinjiangensis]GIF36023.1 ElaA protein [Actinoplanes xinjiangensis]